MRDPIRTQTYDLYLGAKDPASLQGALEQLGQATTDSVYRLRHAEAIAQLGPTAAVVSIPLRATEAELSALLGEIVDVATQLELGRPDRSAAPLDVAELTAEFAARRVEAQQVPRTFEPALSEAPRRRRGLSPVGFLALAILVFLLMYGVLGGGFIYLIASGMH